MAHTQKKPVTNQGHQSASKKTSGQPAPQGAKTKEDPEEDDLERYTHLPSMSAKIRAMAADGYTRPQISRALGLRPQHVRNVLVTPLKRKP